jgi:hypothetical protein
LRGVAIAVVLVPMLIPILILALLYYYIYIYIYLLLLFIRCLTSDTDPMYGYGTSNHLNSWSLSLVHLQCSTFSPHHVIRHSGIVLVSMFQRGWTG